MSHTPGPWTVGDKRGVWVGPVVMANDGQRGVAFVCGESDANARLIAAAPDMRDALEHWLSEWQYLEVNWRDMDATEVDQILSQAELAIERVLAKAEGSSE